METTEQRETLLDTLAEKYHANLTSLPYEDELFMIGIREGKNKFLANLHIHLAKAQLPAGWRDKRYTTDFVTPVALEQLRTKQLKGLEYEHLVPKGAFIQEKCEAKAKTGELTVNFVRDILARYLWTATVTEEEHLRLSRSTMPRWWDKSNIFARYEEAGMKLQVHEKGYMR